MALSEHFPGMTPLSIRRERAKEVFLLIRRLSKRNEKDKEENGERVMIGGREVIKVKAPDTWF